MLNLLCTVYESQTSYGVIVMANVKVFQKWVKGQNEGHVFKFLVSSERYCHDQGRMFKLLVLSVGLVIRNTHAKYENPTTNGAIVMTNIFFQK